LSRRYKPLSRHPPWRSISFYKEDRTTFDLEYQGRYTFAKHDVSWGLSYRSTADSISAYPGILTFTPNEFTQRTSGVFMQDDWTLIPDTLQFGLGARWDDTNLGGSTFAPNATLMWTPNRSNTLWAKYAQAPRMPSRAEQTVSVFSSDCPAVAANADGRADSQLKQWAKPGCREDGRR
jgi:iron complex outermembrane receptor protein